MSRDLITPESALNLRWPLIAARVYNVPLMLHPEKAAIIEAVLREYAAGAPPAIEAVQYAETTERKPYRVTTGGVAVIPVMGTLVNRGSWLDAMSGITSYQRIASQLEAALADSDVRGILLEIDSPGGEAHGVFDLGNKLMAARAQKPLWAMADGDAFSAAYAIASAAEKVFIARTGMAGSIGVIAMHLDQSVRLEKSGMKYTAIIAGDKKADFSSHQPLSDRARATMQNMVDDMYSLFVTSVATARNLSEQAVRDTQAGVYTAPEAQRVGLVDGIATMDEIVAQLERDTSHHVFVPRAAARTQSQRREAMTEKASGAGADQSHAITQSDVDRARAEGATAGRAEGAKAERDRIGAILSHAEAAGREAQARTLALETDLNAEQAAKVLAASPKQAPAAAQGSAFAAAMAAQGNPNVAPGEGGDGKDFDPKAEAARCVELFQGGRRK